MSPRRRSRRKFVGHASRAVIVERQPAQRRSPPSRSSRLRKACGSRSKRSTAANRACTRRSPKAQGRGALAVDAYRAVQLVEHVGSDDAIVAETLDAEQASVGREADLLQILEVPQPTTDIEVVRVR